MCLLVQPLVVEEGFLKQLVAGLYTQNEEHGPCDGMTQEEADARDEDLCVLHDAVAINTLREVLPCHTNHTPAC